jgi:HSP20 family protein
MNTNAHANASCSTAACAGQGPETKSTRVLTPRCDIFESDGVVHVVAEMPGVDESAVDVSVERNVLTIRGRFDAVAPEGLRPLWREFDGGVYQRSFELTSGVDANAIRASMKHGLLRLDVPKHRPALRKIPVHVG